ncbi:MAG: CoA transferase, partial [Pseudomonadota bacterium]|nr:CoA transferase [Pseudomonadota bacterium]
MADKTELLDDPRYVEAEHRKQNAKELRAMFVDLMKTRTTDEWVEHLQMNEVLSNPINTLSGLLTDAHVRASESVGL